ncbi:MAG: hypothetical protein PVJ09_03380 [Candidatus Woesebacteria bacterium]|jgi:hypothetical protein
MSNKKTYTKINETGCCPKPNVKAWDESSVTWKNKKFIKDHTFSFFHIPLNMGFVMKRMWKKVSKAKASPPIEEFLLLSYDPSAWRGEHFMSVTKHVPNAENVTISGTFLTKVFEGPYKEAKNWVKATEDYVKSKGKKLKKLYFFYTTCPKCAKHYGKNYVVALAQV